VQRNIDLAGDFMHRDVYLQINTGSILGNYGNKVKKIASELIYRGYAHFLGTDCTCRTNTYDYRQAVDRIRKEFGEKKAVLLSKEFPEMMLNNEDVPYFYVQRMPKYRSRSFIKRLFGW
jgi:protein-tyrosine phosphatase